MTCTCSKGTQARCLIAFSSPFFGKPLLSFITTCFDAKRRTGQHDTRKDDRHPTALWEITASEENGPLRLSSNEHATIIRPISRKGKICKIAWPREIPNVRDIFRKHRGGGGGGGGSIHLAAGTVQIGAWLFAVGA